MNYIVSDTDMTSVADAIRTKGNTQSPLEIPSGFESAIANLGGDDSTIAELIDRSITEITIPNGVTLIGDNAFRGCTGLTEITIPSGVTRIGDSAFYGCTGLTEITIPNGVTSMGSSVFFNCGRLTSITIPSSVTSMLNAVFHSCSGLNSITCNASMPPTLGTNVFVNVPSACPIYVPAASVDAYKAASGWSDRAAYIQAIPT